MKKSILELKGALMLSKNEQKSINGAGGYCGTLTNRRCCEYNPTKPSKCMIYAGCINGNITYCP
jgi:hypothetical protein